MEHPTKEYSPRLWTARNALKRWMARIHGAGLILTRNHPRILMYHSIVADGSPYATLAPGKYVEQSVFERSMAYLRQHCQPLTLGELASRLAARQALPERAAVVTFDDGYANNLHRATPILQKYGIPATFFVTSGFVDGVAALWTDQVDRYFVHHEEASDKVAARMGVPCRWTATSRVAMAKAWKERMKELPRNDRQGVLTALIEPQMDSAATDAQAPLSWKEVHSLAAQDGMTVASHTMTHPVLAHLNNEEAREEIVGGLQALLGHGVQASPDFAYPYGGFGEYGGAHVALLRNLSFRCAVSTTPGLVSARTDLFSLPRYEGKNDLSNFICHASGLQSLMTTTRRNHGRSCGNC